ncbi:DUF982 domain-containing protein [Limoniibacter endophyticus]|nr:DUF982 domain-containing protein [Limoniibacter endophyticus]
MSDKPFPQPVSVRVGTLVNRISSTWEALELLTSQWPCPKCARYRKAVAACHDTLDGWASIDKAHCAFVEAAESAGLLTETPPIKGKTPLAI